MVTYQNQKIIRIKKPKRDRKFLQINQKDMQAASRNLGGAAFKLYMYLSGNNDGFEIALSQKRFEEAMGVSRNAYHRAVEELIQAGYIVQTDGKVYTFSTEVPAGTQQQEVPSKNRNGGGEGACLKGAEGSTQNGEKPLPKTGREIKRIYNNKYNSIAVAVENGKNNGEKAGTAKEGTSPEKNEGFISDDGLPGRRIRDLSENESKQIQAKIKEGVPYQEIERMYGMRQGTVTVDFTKHWGAFLYARVNGRV